MPGLRAIEDDAAGRHTCLSHRHDFASGLVPYTIAFTQVFHLPTVAVDAGDSPVAFPALAPGDPGILPSRLE